MTREPWFDALSEQEREALTCPTHGFNHYASSCETCVEIVERPGGARDLARAAISHSESE